MGDIKKVFQVALEVVGVPTNLASQTAEILVKDDPKQPNLGRTEEELHIVQSAYTWMAAKREQQQ